MNRTIRNLIIAAPIATAAFALVPTAAMAIEPGPVVVIQPSDPDPEPKPKGPQDKAPAPKPDKPKGPQDKAPAPKPDKPKGPQDKAPAPKPADVPVPQAPQDKAVAPKAADPQRSLDKTSQNGGDGSSNHGATRSQVVDKAADVRVVADLALPSRPDAGPVDQEQSGAELTWLIAGGALVTATGMAFAVRRRARQHA